MHLALNIETVAPLLIESFSVVAALYIWFRFQFSPRGENFRLVRLPEWRIDHPGFFTIFLQALLGGVIFAFLIRLVAERVFSVSADSNWILILLNAGFHLGVLAGIWFSVKRRGGASLNSDSYTEPVAPPLSLGKSIAAGIIVYLAVLPVIGVTMWLWQALLDSAGIPRPKQELIDLFSQTHEPLKLGVLCFVAVVIAPMTEELVFRAGIFRFLRNKVPRAFAFSIPSVLFAAAHGNLNASVPLFVLAVIFSLAYERTGRIVTSAIAHGLFNLTSIVMILYGVDA